MTKNPPTSRKDYKSLVELKQDKLKKDFLNLWYQGYDSTLILLKLGKENFLSHSRICQLVQSEKLTRELTRSCELVVDRKF